MENITPVVLCGGSGKRLWPVSRAQNPKQFHAFSSDSVTLFQKTVQRMAGFGPPVVVTTAELADLVIGQAQGIQAPIRSLVVEPEGRNTAAAIAAAALLLAEREPDAILLVAPADHHVADVDVFCSTIRAAAGAAASGRLVAFGAPAESANTGLGYIQAGGPFVVGGSVFEVERFVEKPDHATARSYVEAGGWLWNSGIFLFQARSLLAELDRLQPDMMAHTRAALDGAREQQGAVILGPAFKSCAPISIDRAVMEMTPLAAVVHARFRWADLGTWDTLYRASKEDDSGNVLQGNVSAWDSRNSLVHSSGPLVCALGVSDLVVVCTGDAVLVTPRARSADIQAVVASLQAAGHEQVVVGSNVQRPWGQFDVLQRGARHQVKRIEVTAGASLSLQSHLHRSEYWIVVSGVAMVTRDGEEMLLGENEAVYLPAGCVHRLQNPGKIPLVLIEVQSGGYLGEDDITRYADTYGRPVSPA